MSVYETKQVYTKTVPETVTHFIVPSFPNAPNLNPQLLMHMNGPNGGTSPIGADATGRHAATFNGAVAFDTSQSFFNGSSLNFSVVGDSVNLDQGADFLMPGDFTIDMRIRFSSFNALRSSWLFDFGFGVGPSPKLLVVVGTHVLDYFFNGSDKIVGTTALALNTWYHVAVTRCLGYTKVFLNGVQEGNTYINNDVITCNTNYPTIGERDITGGDSTFLGWMNEFRLINGIAAWNNNFTPPSLPYMVS